MLLRQAANRRASSPAAPATSRRRSSAAARSADPARPRRRRCACRRQPAHPDRSAQHRRGRAALAARMQQLDPADAAAIAARSPELPWRAGRRRCSAGQQQAAPLRGTPIVTYHKNWAYLEDWLGLREVGTIEPKPGVPPGSQYLAQLVAELPARGVRGGICMPPTRTRAPPNSSHSASACRRSCCPSRSAAPTGRRDLFGLFDDTIDRLLQRSRRSARVPGVELCDPAAGVPRRAAGARDACAARPARAGTRHRLHRPRDRPGRRARRRRRRRDGLGAAGLVGADQRRLGGAAERGLPAVERAAVRGACRRR